jgi:diaminopimelate decarboxylase
MSLLTKSKIYKNLQLPFDLKQIQRLIQEQNPTPFYIYDEEGLIQKAEDIKTSFQTNLNSKYHNYFAVKALPNPEIMKLLDKQDMGFDCSSMAELLLCERIGAYCDTLPNGMSKIMFTSNQTHYSEYQKCKDLGGIINFDDITHLAYFKENVGKFPDTISLRFNPGKERSFGENDRFIGNPADAKFGMTKDQLFTAYKTLKSEGVQKLGLHTMVVSNELNPQAHILTLKMLLDLVLELEKKEIKIDFINLGGGLGVNYKPEEKEIDLQTLSQEMGELLKEYENQKKLSKDLIILGENGRFITGPHGYLITKVRHQKNTYKKYLGLDATMANLMRPGMYGAYHHIINLTKLEQAGNLENYHQLETEKYDIVGSLCENNDKFAVDRILPKTDIDDILVIMDGGAHSHSMGFNYNGKLRSAEFLLTANKKFKMIRRPETYRDLFATLVDYSD